MGSISWRNDGAATNDFPHPIKANRTQMHIRTDAAIRVETFKLGDVIVLPQYGIPKQVGALADFGRRTPH
jgi:hypothetical protein